MNKVQFFGRGYIVNHCIALLKNLNEEKAYRIYIASGIESIAYNTAHMLKNGGKFLQKSYADLFKKQDDRTGDEIADDVLSRCGLAGDK